MLSRFQGQQPQNQQNIYRESNASFLSYDNERVAVRRNFLESLKQSLHESFITNIGLMGLSVLKIVVIILVFIFESIPTFDSDNPDLQKIEKQIQGVTEIRLWLICMLAYDGLNIFYLFYIIFVINKYQYAAQRRGLRENLLSEGGLGYFGGVEYENSIQQINNIGNNSNNNNNNNNNNNININANNNINISSQNQVIQSQISLDMELNMYDIQNEVYIDVQNDQNNANQQIGINQNINFLEFASNRDKILKYSSLLTKIIYLVLFLLGNYFAYINKGSQSVFPQHYYILLWLVALGYFSFGIQILLFLSICLCFPLTLFLYVLMRNRSNSSIPANNEIVSKLVPILYEEKINSQEFESQKECCICLVDYQLNDQIISLPCSKMHHYHYDCVVKWLNISGVCPICKSPLDQYAQELEDVKESYQFY